MSEHYKMAHTAPEAKGYHMANSGQAELHGEHYDMAFDGSELKKSEKKGKGEGYSEAKK